MFQYSLSCFFDGHAYYRQDSNVRRTRAGTPNATTPSGISRTTTEPAPTIVIVPMLTQGMVDAPIARCESTPRRDAPAITAFGETFAKSPMSTSCSTTADVLTMAPSPIFASAFIAAWAITTVPRPSWAERETDAVGCTTVTNSTPHEMHFSASPLRKKLSPTPSATATCVMPASCCNHFPSPKTGSHKTP